MPGKDIVQFKINNMNLDERENGEIEGYRYGFTTHAEARTIPMEWFCGLYTGK